MGTPIGPIYTHPACRGNRTASENIQKIIVSTSVYLNNLRLHSFRHYVYLPTY